MGDLVYLFDVDSVFNTTPEIQHAQNALFDELVLRGNRVVITMNQLTDGLGFLAAIRDEKTYDAILRLFQLGKLKISRYGSIRTASQYIQQVIQKCINANADSFIFSGLPITGQEQELLRVMQDALRYSDLSGISEMIANEKEQADSCTSEAEKEIHNAEVKRLQYIYRYIKMILFLSTEELASNAKKETPGVPMTEFLNRVISFGSGECREELEALPENQRTHIIEGVKVLIEVRDQLKELEEASEANRNISNNRTNWIHKLYEMEEAPECCWAEMMVNLCYNYALEDSISGVTLHYRRDKLESFYQDFAYRLERYHREYEEGLRVLHKGEESSINNSDVALTNWTVGIHILEQKSLSQMLENKRNETNQIENSHVYEAGFRRKHRKWNWRLGEKLLVFLALLVAYVGLFVIVEMGLSTLEDIFVNGMNEFYIPEWISSIIDILAFGIIGSVISEILHVPDILDSLKSFGQLCVDLLVIKKAPKWVSYIKKTTIT